MKTHSWLFAAMVVTIWLAAPFTASPATAQDSDAAAKILALENKWNIAYKERDVAAMNSLLANDFIITIITVEDGNTYSKSGYIAHAGDTSTKVEISELLDMRVRLHGNTAIVTGQYHEVGTEKGKRYEYHDRLTDTWMLLDGRWRVIASHYSVPVK
jgi:ketosteroid isomerase-like protein